MTNSEAIKWLNEAEILDLISGNTKDRQAVDAAIEALGKQIPKKPSGKGNNLMLHYRYCPQCGKQLTMYDWKMPYCLKCGQAIDWE